MSDYDGEYQVMNRSPNLTPAAYRTFKNRTDLPSAKKNKMSSIKRVRRIPEELAGQILSDRL